MTQTLERMKALGLASLAALVVQPFVFLLWFGLPFLFSAEALPLKDLGGVAVWILAFAAAHLVILGLPSFVMLQRFRSANWLTVSLTGILAGGVPIALYGWPLRNSSGNYSSGGTWFGQYREFVINGNPTIYGWLQYAQGIAMFGLHGLVGALMFYYVWSTQMRSNESFKPNPLCGSA